MKFHYSLLRCVFSLHRRTTKRNFLVFLLSPSNITPYGMWIRLKANIFTLLGTSTWKYLLFRIFLRAYRATKIENEAKKKKTLLWCWFTCETIFSLHKWFSIYQLTSPSDVSPFRHRSAYVFISIFIFAFLWLLLSIPPTATKLFNQENIFSA